MGVQQTAGRSDVTVRQDDVSGGDRPGTDDTPGSGCHRGGTHSKSSPYS